MSPRCTRRAEEAPARATRITRAVSHAAQLQYITAMTGTTSLLLPTEIDDVVDYLGAEREQRGGHLATAGVDEPDEEDVQQCAPRARERAPSAFEALPGEAVRERRQEVVDLRSAHELADQSSMTFSTVSRECVSPNSSTSPSTARSTCCACDGTELVNALTNGMLRCMPVSVWLTSGPNVVTRSARRARAASSRLLYHSVSACPGAPP